MPKDTPPLILTAKQIREIIAKVDKASDRPSELRSELTGKVGERFEVRAKLAAYVERRKGR